MNLLAAGDQFFRHNIKFCFLVLHLPSFFSQISGGLEDAVDGQYYKTRTHHTTPSN